MIVAGFGFRTLASASSLLNALDKAAEEHGISTTDILVFSTPSDKAESEVFQSLVSQASTRLKAVPIEAMTDAQTLTHSERVQEMRGTGSVAEACALFAAGPKGELLGPRVVSDDRMATCALAKGDHS